MGHFRNQAKTVTVRLTDEEHQLLKEKHLAYMVESGRVVSLTEFIKVRCLS